MSHILVLTYSHALDMTSSPYHPLRIMLTLRIVCQKLGPSCRPPSRRKPEPMIPIRAADNKNATVCKCELLKSRNAQLSTTLPCDLHLALVGLHLFVLLVDSCAFLNPTRELWTHSLLCPRRRVNADKPTPAAKSEKVRSGQSATGQDKSAQFRSGEGNSGQLRSGHP